MALKPRLRLLLATLLLAFAHGVPAASAAPAVDGISARAVNADGSAYGRAFFVERMDAGDTYTGHIAISNSGKRFARLYVDAVDGVTSNRGGIVFAPRDADDQDVGAWITPEKKLIRLDPGDEKVVPFTVTVPEGTWAGDHVGGIAIEPLRRATSGGQFSVTQVLRVAIAMQVRVRGPVKRELLPKVLSLKAIPGSEIPALTIRLANNGDLLCRPTLTATLYSGKTMLRSERREIDTILARAAIDYPLYWPNGLKAGTYTAAVRTQNCGKTHETQAEVKLANDLSGSTPPARPGVVPDAPGEPTPTWVWIAIAAAIALLLALALWLARRGRRKQNDREKELELRERELELREREAAAASQTPAAAAPDTPAATPAAPGAPPASVNPPTPDAPTTTTPDQSPSTPPTPDQSAVTPPTPDVPPAGPSGPAPPAPKAIHVTTDDLSAPKSPGEGDDGPKNPFAG